MTKFDGMPDFKYRGPIHIIGSLEHLEKIPKNVQNRFRDFHAEVFKITRLEDAYKAMTEFLELQGEVLDLYPVGECLYLFEPCMSALCDLWASIDAWSQAEPGFAEETRVARKVMVQGIRELLADMAETKRDLDKPSASKAFR